MTKQGRLEFDGYVTHANQGGLVPVTLDHNVAMLAKVCGNVRCHGMRVALGDRECVDTSSSHNCPPHGYARRRRRCGKETRMSTDIYVDNLPFNATAGEIRDLFCPYGTVENVHLIKDRETGWLRGFGFVEMTSGANEAIAALNDSELGGSRLKVKYPATWRQERPPRSRHW